MAPDRPRARVAGPPGTLALGVALAAGAALAAALGWFAAVHWAPVRIADALGSIGALDASDAWHRTADALLSLVRVRYLALVVVAAGGLLWLRGRRWSALVPLVVVGGANLMSDALKSVLPREDIGVGDVGLGSWPSGHTTAVASAAFALVLAAPRRARPALAVLGTAVAVVVGSANIGVGGHRPGDVCGGVLLAAAWAFAAAPFVADGSGTSRAGRAVATGLAAIGVAAAIGAVVGVAGLAHLAVVADATAADAAGALRTAVLAVLACTALTAAALELVLGRAAADTTPPE
ncbi:MAG: phosphatase PAP2 family protein [Actinomycetales bacterium]|nr:phosphatase PAP2 family protein [Actinomycetales bacterium]